MRRTHGFILAALAMLPAGCAQKHAAPVAHEPRLTMDHLAPNLPAAADAFVLLANEESTGRFASALAIAKLIPDLEHESPALTLVELKPMEQALWAEQMRGVRLIREVLYITPRIMKPVEPTPENLCAQAERLGASLLLTYAPNGLGPNSAQVLGVLYDTASRRPLATLHAGAEFLDEKGVETSLDKQRGDLRDRDARYQSQRAFERHALACLNVLMHQDQPPTSTQPHKWHQPLAERWWLPK